MKNKYNISIDKIKVSDELKKKILSDSYAKKNIKPRFSAVIKCACAIAACVIFIFSINTYRLSLDTQRGNQGNQNMLAVNSFENVDSIKELKNKVKYEFKFPSFTPDGYEITSSGVLGGNIINIVFSNGQYDITYRTAPMIADISGDYNKYTTVDNEKIANCNVMLKSNYSLYYVASWDDGSMSYSIIANSGIDKKTMLKIIESIMY